MGSRQASPVIGVHRIISDDDLVEERRRMVFLAIVRLLSRHQGRGEALSRTRGRRRQGDECHSQEDAGETRRRVIKAHHRTSFGRRSIYGPAPKMFRGVNAAWITSVRSILPFGRELATRTFVK